MAERKSYEQEMQVMTPGAFGSVIRVLKTSDVKNSLVIHEGCRRRLMELEADPDHDLTYPGIPPGSDSLDVASILQWIKRVGSCDHDPSDASPGAVAHRAMVHEAVDQLRIIESICWNRING